MMTKSKGYYVEWAVNGGKQIKANKTLSMMCTYVCYNIPHLYFTQFNERGYDHYDKFPFTLIGDIYGVFLWY
jgi:Cu/Ag efflux pump CusA